MVDNRHVPLWPFMPGTAIRRATCSECGTTMECADLIIYYPDESSESLTVCGDCYLSVCCLVIVTATRLSARTVNREYRGLEVVECPKTEECFGGLRKEVIRRAEGISEPKARKAIDKLLMPNPQPGRPWRRKGRPKGSPST